MKKSIFVFILCLFALQTALQPAAAREDSANPKPTVIPSLQEWKGGIGDFHLTDFSRIVVSASDADALNETAFVFQEDLQEITGRHLPVYVSDDPLPGDFYLSLNETADESLGAEGYLFQIGDYALIRANTPVGVFYGTRTALQILAQDPEKSRIAKGTAKDYPKYAVRGFMLDVGRKFFPIEFLKEYVKFMSYYKMNDFHLHLNDNAIFKDNSREHWNQYSAFRLENTKYPALTATDGYYTKQDFRELQDIAKVHGVTITPEIDTPSHSLALTKVRPDLVHDQLPVDHLDITRQEAIDFVLDIWSEYLDGNWFDAEAIHFGADEFAPSLPSTYEVYRQYLNTLNQFFKSKGKTSRMWGSLSMFPGSVPVDNDIVVNVWNTGWHHPEQAINEGFKIINTVDAYLYIVPKAGYYYDYLNTRWLYDNWDPTVFGNNIRLNENEPNLLGGMFAVWNDLLGKKVSAADVHDRVKHAMPVLAEKMWKGNAADLAFSEFQQLAEAIGDPPSVNLEHKVKSQTELVISYSLDEGSGTIAADGSGNGYDGQLHHVQWTEEGKSGKAAVFNDPQARIETGLDVKGFPWTVTAWVNIKDDGREEMALTESPYGALKLRQKDGKAGFSREGFDFSFDVEIPAGRWVHVAFQGDPNGTSLYIDGELKSTLPETTLLPIAAIGSRKHALKGALDEFKLFDRMLTKREIAEEAGSPPWTVNIAAHKPAAASSAEADGFTADKAFDEIVSKHSRWSSGYSDNEWIYVDLKDVYEIGKVVLIWEDAYARSYKIQVSTDLQTWTDVFVTGAGSGGTETIVFPAVQARYVRMLGLKRATGYGYSLYEFEVYPANPNEPVPAPVPVRYFRDFEDGTLDGWEHVIGKGAGSMELVPAPGEEGRAIQFSANSVNNIFVDQNSPAIKDGEAEFEITPQSDDIRAGIIFRYENEHSWASVGFDRGAWYWANAQGQWGLMTDHSEAALQKGVTSKVKVRFEGRYITLSVNGTVYFDGMINELPTGEGKMGARVFHAPTVAVFDNFRYDNFVPEPQPIVPYTSLTGPKQAESGAEFEVTLNVGGIASPALAMDVTAAYPADLAEFVSASPQSAGVSIIDSKQSEGTIRLIMASQGADYAVNGDAALLKLKFKAKPLPQTAAATISIVRTVLGDADGKEAEADTSAWDVVIRSTSSVLPGDLNGDGKFTIGDLAMAAFHYGKTSSSPDWERIRAADVNGNGVIDIGDLAAIAQKII